LLRLRPFGRRALLGQFALEAFGTEGLAAAPERA
jgi:hypothetical protein